MRKSFGSYEIARFCEVTPVTVGRWFKEGKLPFFLTGGGQKRVWADDLRPFLAGLKLPIPPEVVANGRQRVLIVDDDAVFRRALLRLLKSEFPALEPLEAADGFEGGLKVAQLRPALVLLDLKLPGQDGFKVCRMIRADPNLKRVKIACLSALPVDEARRQALAAGADDFLSKPFNADQLRALLAKLAVS
jgi:CheY-like chemotaxis protein